MKTVLAVVFAALVCGWLAWLTFPKTQDGPSAARVAGDVVRGMAQSAGVKILGDYIYSEKTLPDGRVQVAVRVKFEGIDMFGMLTVGHVTVFVRLLPHSGWTVVG